MATKTTRYIEVTEKEIPAGVRFDVPRRYQGTGLEIAFGGFDRAEHDEGDLYKRVTDFSTGGHFASTPRYYKRADA